MSNSNLEKKYVGVTILHHDEQPTDTDRAMFDALKAAGFQPRLERSNIMQKATFETEIPGAAIKVCTGTGASTSQEAEIITAVAKVYGSDPYIKKCDCGEGESINILPPFLKHAPTEKEQMLIDGMVNIDTMRMCLVISEIGKKQGERHAAEQAANMQPHTLMVDDLVRPGKDWDAGGQDHGTVGHVMSVDTEPEDDMERMLGGLLMSLRGEKPEVEKRPGFVLVEWPDGTIKHPRQFWYRDGADGKYELEKVAKQDVAQHDDAFNSTDCDKN